MIKPTSKTAHKIPPRKYFDLEDASRKLTKDTGEEFTEKDIIYYANEGLIELSVYIDLEIKVDEADEDDEEDKPSCEYCKLEIRGVDFNKLEELEELCKAEIRCFSSGKTPKYIKGKLFEAYTNDKFDYKKSFEDMMKQCEMSEFGFIDREDFFTQQNEKYLDNFNGVEFILEDDDYICLDLKTNIRKLKGFFAIDFEDLTHLFLDNKNPIINTGDVLFRPARSDNIQNGFGFYLIGYDWKNKSLFEINKNSIFVTYEELEILKQGKKKIRSIRTFEDEIEEMKYSTRVLEPEYIQKKNYAIREDQIEMFSFEKIPFKVANDELFDDVYFSEDTPQTKNKGGRAEHKLKQEAITIAKAIYEAYGQDITRITLATELAEYLAEKHKKRILNREFSAISVETIRNYLKELNIGNSKGKSKNLDFKNL